MTATPNKARVELDKIQEMLIQLKLEHSAELLSEMIQESVKANHPPHRFLDRLLSTELEHREERRAKTSLRISGLPPGQTLSNFDWSFQPGIERKRIETLATCAYIREHESSCFKDHPVSAKLTWPSPWESKPSPVISVGYYRLDDLLHAMKQDVEVPPRRLKGKKYLKNALLVIDEVGFQQLTRQEASLLFRLVSYRYEKGSTIITTNKSVKDWPEVLAGDEVMTTALLDRLLHRCHVFNIKGRSYRLRDLDGRTS